MAESEDRRPPANAYNPENLEIPYAPQDPALISQVVQELEDHTKGNRKDHFKVKKTRFEVLNSPAKLTVSSWKLMDWDYKRRDLPTYARGLFTTRRADKSYEIAIRGYDKFFNVGEVRETEWANIRNNTIGPYELSLKENGCIIFIAGLADDTLLVCSKHSTGPRSDCLSHAVAGEQRLEEQLAKIGKTKQDLARELRKRNATAIAELCDDSFEEHILAYGPDKAGLYLHGININQPYFMTYPGPLVNNFADQWGFKQTGLIVMDDIDKVKAFLDEAAETGAYGGRDVEGFVIRCRMSSTPGKDPYKDWFFKYKFEEPYLMYRQWRECTKALIAQKAPKFKKHKKITEEYLLFARKRLASDPQLAKNYNQNHGIIGLRDEFLAFKNLKGSDAANMDLMSGSGQEPDPKVTSDVILVPIATIGCGKTTVAVALTHLFDFGHVQNDNIMGKGRPPRFTKWVLDELKEHKAVVADRNNAQRHERKQIITDIKLQHTTARLVALNFVHENMDEVRRVTQDRVFARGDNHQTIQAATDQSKVAVIMEGFLGRFEPYNPLNGPDAGFDAVIDLDPTIGSRANLETVVKELHALYPNLIPNIPTAEEMDDAIAAALGDYQPELRHTIPDRSNSKQTQPPPPRAPKKKRIEYMSVAVPAATVKDLLEKAFFKVTPEQARMYTILNKSRRIQNTFHVTLMHKSAQAQHPELWKRYAETLAEADSAASAIGQNFPYPDTPPLGECEVQLERVVWNERIMAIVVRLIGDASAEENKWECTNRVPHITVGTRDNSVKPVESNDLLARWLDEDNSGPGGKIEELSFGGGKYVKGTVKAVLSR